MRGSIAMLAVVALAACGDRDDASMRQEMSDLVRSTTALVREARAARPEPAAPAVFETLETDGGTIVIAIWPGGEHEIWRVGTDGTVVSLAYRNAGESMRRTETSVTTTRDR